jgi:hypothetical protein
MLNLVVRKVTAKLQKVKVIARYFPGGSEANHESLRVIGIPAKF